MADDQRTQPAGPGRPQEARAREFRMLIDGAWTAGVGGHFFSCVDPFTEAEWGRIPEAGAADVDAAVHAARRAFDKSGWPQTPAARRAALLRRLAQLIEANADRLVRQQIWENGKLIAEMGPGIQVLAGDCYFYAGLAETVHGMTVPPAAPNFVTYTLREPIGVVAAITPWNSPLLLLGWKLFPALAAGNTVVIKPSEITPTSTLMLAELAVEAGFPAGVINVVTPSTIRWSSCW
jgi:acyl-CoA reductase-like NAD-dependent aldehyde dehydrogenase